MLHRIALERVKSGFKIRAATLNGTGVGNDATDSPNSLFAAFEGHKTGVGKAFTVDPRWLAVYAASSARDLSVQLASLRALAPAEDHAFATCYAVGSFIGQTEPPEAQLEVASDADYSVLVETCMRAGLINDTQMAADIRRQSVGFVRRAFPNAPFRRATPQARISYRLRKLHGGPAPRNLSELRGLLAQIKLNAVHLIGPDILTILQSLLDPKRSFDLSTIEASLSVLDDWKLLSTGSLMLCFRLLGRYPAEREYLATHFERVAKTLPIAAYEAVCRILENRPIKNNLESQDYYINVLLAIENLAFAMKAESPIDVHEAIVRLFFIDPIIVEFCPWAKILDIVEVMSLSDTQSLFTTMLMRSRPVQQLLPRIVAMRAGDGAFIGELTQFVLAVEKPDILQIFQRLRRMPDEAAQAVAMAILEPSIFEKLIGAFHGRAALGDLQRAGDNLHLMRIEALRFALARGLITQRYAEVQSADEAGRARLHNLETSMLMGRVRVPLDTVTKATNRLLEGLPVNSLSNGQRAPAEVIDRASDYLARGISSEILFESAANINQSLNDNLRHGIVVPRVLRAFNDAFQSESDRGPPQVWDEAILSNQFEQDAAAISRLRENANTKLREFQTNHLRIARGEAFEAELQERIEQVSKAFFNGESRETGIETAIAQAVVGEVKRYLKVASNVFLKTVAPSILNELREVRAISRANKNPRTTTYLDGLETSLHRAFEEVDQWIAVAERADAPPFTVDLLVNLEQRIVMMRDPQKLKVNIICQDRRRPDQSARSLLIKGSYFDLFQEVVHNLISNSYKYSGMKARTEIEFELSCSPKRLVIRCVNNMSDVEALSIAERFDEIVESARNPATEQADKDILSGFSKIHRAFHIATGMPINIQILPISTKRLSFAVEITLIKPPEIWHGFT